MKSIIVQNLVIIQHFTVENSVKPRFKMASSHPRMPLFGYLWLILLNEYAHTRCCINPCIFSVLRDTVLNGHVAIFRQKMGFFLLFYTIHKIWAWRCHETSDLIGWILITWLTALAQSFRLKQEKFLKINGQATPERKEARDKHDCKVLMVNCRLWTVLCWQEFLSFDIFYIKVVQSHHALMSKVKVISMSKLKVISRSNV